MCEAGSSPTRTVARPTCPSSATEAATSSRTFAPSALPSMSVAVIASEVTRASVTRHCRLRACGRRARARASCARRSRSRSGSRVWKTNSQHVGVAVLAFVRSSSKRRWKRDDVRVRRAAASASCGIEQPRRAARVVRGRGRSRARARTTRRTARGASGRGLGDVDGEHAVAVGSNCSRPSSDEPAAATRPRSTQPVGRTACRASRSNLHGRGRCPAASPTTPRR